MPRLILEEGKLQITTSAAPPKIVSLALNALRVVSLFMPGECDWPCAEATAQHNLVNLDEVTVDDLPALIEQLSAMEAGEIKLFLEDYAGRYAVFTLQDMRESQVDLLPELASHREERRDRLADWTRNVPGLIVTGAQGDMAAFGPRGVRAGAHFLAWEDLGEVQVRPSPAEDQSAYRFVPRPGCDGDTLVVRMPDGKEELFVAECTFWRALAEQRAVDAA